MSALAELGSGKYISLTTYRKDGTPVATPVWVVLEDDHLLVITDGNSGKAKRLRNSSRAAVAPCDIRGRVTGEAVEAEATLLDEAGTTHVLDAVIAKYGLLARAMNLRSTLESGLARLRKRKYQSTQVGIRVVLKG